MGSMMTYEYLFVVVASQENQFILNRPFGMLRLVNNLWYGPYLYSEGCKLGVGSNRCYAFLRNVWYTVKLREVAGNIVIYRDSSFTERIIPVGTYISFYLPSYSRVVTDFVANSEYLRDVTELELRRYGALW